MSNNDILQLYRKFKGFKPWVASYNKEDGGRNILKLPTVDVTDRQKDLPKVSWKPRKLLGVYSGRSDDGTTVEELTNEGGEEVLLTNRNGFRNRNNIKTFHVSSDSPRLLHRASIPQKNSSYWTATLETAASLHKTLKLSEFKIPRKKKIKDENLKPDDMDLWVPRLATESVANSSEEKKPLSQRVSLPSLYPVQGEKVGATVGSGGRNRYYPKSLSATFPNSTISRDPSNNIDIREYPDRVQIDRSPLLFYDSDEDLDASITLPRIEEILRDEGVQQLSISQQISTIKNRKTREHDRVKQRLNKRKKHSPVRIKSLQYKWDEYETAKAISKSQEVPLLAVSRKKTDGNEVSAQNDKSINDMEEEEMTATVSSSNDQSQSPDKHLAKQALEQYLQEIEVTRWVSHQQMERTLVGPDFEPPRLVLIPSNVPDSEDLARVIRPSGVLALRYDYERSELTTLLDQMLSVLSKYRDGCKAKSLLIYCQGGSGYVYFIKKHLLTSQKLQKRQDLSSFWKEVGNRVLSKLPPNGACIHFMGCDVTQQDDQLLLDLDSIIVPNRIKFLNPKLHTKSGRSILAQYLEIDAYDKWVTQTKE